MTEQPGGVSDPDTPPFSFGTGGASRAIALVCALVALWTVVVLPLRIVGVGFRPTDDARRHAAKVLADKPWSEILVLRPEATVDPHPGWHALLSLVHRAGVDSATGLVVFSTVSLAVLFLCVPLALGYVRGEAWLLALLVAALGSAHLVRRIMIGRPFIFTMAVLVALAVLWPRLRSERLARGPWVGLVALFALSTWIHGNWYLWALPLACFVLAGELRAAGRVAGAMAIGTAIGATATGAPLDFLGQTLQHPLWALTTDLPKRVLVVEFQPSTGEPLIVVAVLALLVWRHLRHQPLAPLLRDPIALLTVSGWALGFHTLRFWTDWGLPACLVLMAREFDAGLTPIPRHSRARLRLSIAIAAVLFLAVTNDRQSRWSGSERSAFLALDNPAHRDWLPAPGGILYSNQMRIFYNTFWRNPRAQWRYILGFEPALMPPADLAIYRRIQLDFASDASFAPWVAKMRPADRLAIVRAGSAAPKIAALEWHSPYRGLWIGRLPTGAVPAQPTRVENGSESESADDAWGVPSSGDEAALEDAGSPPSADPR